MLLVDGDFDSRNVYRAILIAERVFRGRSRVKVRRAQVFALALKPKIIISKLVLPRLNGLDLLARLKQNPHTASIPFVFLAATESAEHRHRALSLGARH